MPVERRYAAMTCAVKRYAPRRSLIHCLLLATLLLVAVVGCDGPTDETQPPATVIRAEEDAEGEGTPEPDEAPAAETPAAEMPPEDGPTQEEPSTAPLDVPESYPAPEEAEEPTPLPYPEP
jgi:hypothetical protein